MTLHRIANTAATLFCLLAFAGILSAPQELFLQSASAQLHPPEIRGVYPLGGSAGATTRVTIAGVSLRGASRIVFEKPGITAKIAVPDPASVPALTLDSDGNPNVTVDFTVDRSAERGVWFFRVVSGSGVSSMAKWVVGRELPAMEEKDPNNGMAQAQAVTLPVSINGHISDQTDTDTFACDLEAGKTFVAEINAGIADSPLDSLLALHDGDGRQVASNDDSEGPDSRIIYKVPKSGRYFVTASSSVGSGGGDQAYRLNLGYLPVLTGTFPASLPRGKAVTLTPIGVNLPPSLTVIIPATMRFGLTHLFTPEPPSSNGIIVGVSDLPGVMEQEPNNDISHATLLPAPGIANGRFYRPDGSPGEDLDFYKFHADAGHRYIIDVQSQDRSGIYADPLLTLYDAAGKMLEENDDSLGRDSHLDRTFDKTGDYYLRVKNQTGAGAPALTYQLQIQDGPPPGFALAVETRSRAIGRGDRTPLEVVVERDRWDGPVTVTAADLPPGVTATTCIVPPGFNRGVIVLSADANAPLDAFPLHVVGTADVNGQKIQRVSRAADWMWKGGVRFTTPSLPDLIAMAVANPFEVGLQADTAPLTLMQGQAVKIKVYVDRRAAYPKPMTLTVLGLPDGVTVTNIVHQSTMAAEVELELKAMPNARLGVYSIVPDGMVTHNPQVTLDRVSLPILLTVAPVKKTAGIR